MSRDVLAGVLILVASIIGILVYNWLLFFSDWGMIVLKITAFVAVTGVLAILAWIGYTLATTPPPKPIEEIEKELGKELTEEKKE
ncbi:MAG: transcriptional regulator [Candidatus Caldarchaeales archaeon]